MQLERGDTLRVDKGTIRFGETLTDSTSMPQTVYYQIMIDADETEYVTVQVAGDVRDVYLNEQEYG